jgi:hypothetical protein
MLRVTGDSFRSCDGLTRRSLLKAGVLGLGGVCLSDLLRHKALATPASPGEDRSVILVWLDGGPPQHETYDPKPEAPSEFRGPLGAIPTAIPGVQISELFPRQARLLDKISLIRSMHHDNGDHFAAAHWMLTGYHGSNAVNLAPQYPSAASVITRLKGTKRPGVPPYVGLPTTHSIGLVPGYHGAAYLGVAYNPFAADCDPNAEGFRVESVNLPDGISVGRLGDRAGMLHTFDAARHSAESSLDDVDRFTQQAFDMLTGPATRLAFQLDREDPRLRDRYGRHTWGQSALLARRLVQAGVRFVTLTFGGWDFHSSLEAGMKRVLPIVDNAVASLIEDLDQHGMLESTMVIVMGEFGRTPLINKGLPGIDPVPGRDHWGNVMSVLVTGGGITPGIIVGESNSKGEVPKERPITPQDFVATIYDRLGLDLETIFLDRLKRPIPIVGPGGTPIRELL